MIIARASLVSILICLSGCAKGAEVYAVDGTKGSFCLPRELTVPDLAWVPPDPPNAAKEFAFSGCWNPDKDAQISCGLPPEIRGGVIGPKKAFKGRLWQNFDDGALIKRIALQTSSTVDLSSNGQVVVVSNSSLDWNWYVWRKSEAIAQNILPSPLLRDDDELLAVCQTVNVLVPQKGQRNMISCDRYVVGTDYYLKYSFESEERIPRDLDGLDAQVIKQVESWRCN